MPTKSEAVGNPLGTGEPVEPALLDCPIVPRVNAELAANGSVWWAISGMAGVKDVEEGVETLLPC